MSNESLDTGDFRSRKFLHYSLHKKSIKLSKRVEFLAKDETKIYFFVFFQNFFFVGKKVGNLIN